MNVAAFVFRPDYAVFDAGAPIDVVVDGRSVWKAIIADGQELRIAAGTARLEPAKPRNLTAWHTETVARAPLALNMQGDEKLLANWITDAMRAMGREWPIVPEHMLEQSLDNLEQLTTS